MGQLDGQRMQSHEIRWDRYMWLMLEKECIRPVSACGQGCPGQLSSSKGAVFLFVGEDGVATSEWRCLKTKETMFVSQVVCESDTLSSSQLQQNNGQLKHDKAYNWYAYSIII